jgi:hypothetical protein
MLHPPVNATTSATLIHPLNTSTAVSTATIIMPKTTNHDSEATSKEESIKAAVREATLKTQERLAAYQQKQQQKKAAAAAVTEKPPSRPSAEKVNTEDKLSRLHALVNESKRLTTKSRDLNNNSTVCHTDMELPSRSSNTSQNTNSLGAQSSSCHAAPSPRGKQLAGFLQNLGGSSSSQRSLSGASHQRSLSGASHQLYHESFLDKQPKNDKLLAPQPHLHRSESSGLTLERRNNTNTNNLNNPRRMGERGDSVQDLVAPLVQAGILSSSSRYGEEQQKQPAATLERGSSVQDLVAPLVQASLSSGILGSSSRHGMKHEEPKEDGASKKSEPAASQQTHPQRFMDQQEDDDDVYVVDIDDLPTVPFGVDDDDGGRPPADSSGKNSKDGEPSIFDMISKDKKKRNDGLDHLTPEEIEEMMEEYYDNSFQSSLNNIKTTAEDLNSSMPGLEDIVETPKVLSKKKKKTSKHRGSSKKNKNHHSSNDNNNEDGEESEQSASDSDHPDSSQNDMDSSMPQLAPMETPKTEKS